MPAYPWSSVVLAITLLRPVVGEAATASALDSLVAAERAFAARSVEKGVRDAFLEYLAEDGVIFRPLATHGRQSWESRGSVATTLMWEPACAEVSAAGDLGYTTGPWESRPNDPQRPTGYGHYVSVWQKQAGGSWRVAVDIGVAHAQPKRGLGSGDFTPGPLHTAARRAACRAGAWRGPGVKSTFPRPRLGCAWAMPTSTATRQEPSACFCQTET
jgi:ketosteroid isomerase-like protein